MVEHKAGHQVINRALDSVYGGGSVVMSEVIWVS